MKSTIHGLKPRITEVQHLRAMVAQLKDEGIAPDEIQRQIVSVAIVDLDDLNALLKAA